MIRLYEEKDYDPVILLGMKVNPIFPEAYNVKDVPDNEQIYLFEEDNEIIGFIQILINIDDIEIINLIVDETHRRKKVATFLLDHLLSEDIGTKERIILEVRRSNEAALNLYRKFGFNQIGERKNYYGNEDAVVMERRIN